MKMQADLDLSEVPDADCLRERLEAYADDHGTRVIPGTATLEVLTTTRYDDRPGGGSTVVPTGLRFSWEA